MAEQLTQKVAETKTTTVLRMIFTLENAKTAQFNLTNPKSGVTRTEVDDIMTEMIEDRFILKDNNEATKIKEAYIYQTNKIDLA